MLLEQDENIRYQCSSGGVSFEIGKYLINQGYQAIGVRYNTEKYCGTLFSKTIEEFAESIGSKYIQSSTINGFANINKNDKFLITGTPCQIDSIRRYIKIQYRRKFYFNRFFVMGSINVNVEQIFKPSSKNRSNWIYLLAK